MQGETIVCIAPRKWDALWRESQQIMSRMAKNNRILYFEPGRDANGKLLSEMQRNFSNFFKAEIRNVEKNLTIISSPSYLPLASRHLPKSVLRFSVPSTVYLNSKISISFISRVLRRFQLKDPILWLYSPTSDRLVGNFGEKLAVYHNYDEFPDFEHNKKIKQQLRDFDNKLCQSVDIVFATSSAQTKQRLKVNPETHFVPNGVNFELFNQAMSEDVNIPEDIKNIPGPIIGFAGWMGYHIDTELLVKIAQKFPKVSLVLVGPDDLPYSPSRDKLYTIDNVYFLGQKENKDLPRYLSKFDVGLMPYNLNGHVASAYPLKLHEYLAAGLPTVGSNLPELYPFEHVIGVARSQNEFINLVEGCLKDHSWSRLLERLNVAKENTWDVRVEAMYEIINNYWAKEDKLHSNEASTAVV